jgi:hypothetical protein
MSSEYHDKEQDTIPQNFDNFIPSWLKKGKENSENQTNIKKKGKSTPLPEDAENIFLKVKTHYENKNKKVPCLFSKVGIRKKLKTHFFKWIKKLMGQKIIQVPGHKKSKFKKLNQGTIANISLKFNSVLLNKTVFQVYDEDCEENKKLIQILLNNSNKETLQFLYTPFYLLYNDYLESKQFIKDFKKIQKKINYLLEDAETEEDKNIISLYLEIYEIFSENFANYFMKTCPNHRSFPTNRRRYVNFSRNGHETEEVNYFEGGVFNNFDLTREESYRHYKSF